MEELTQKSRLDLSVLVMSYDGFWDVWAAFDACFEKYWRCSAPVYLATNHKQPECKAMQVFSIGDACYSEGIRQFVTQCQSRYVLLLLADFMPSNPITDENFTALLAYLQQEDIDYCSLYKQKDKSRYYKRYKDADNLLAVDMAYVYAVNMMPAIWKTDYLRELVEMGECNPWEFEVALQGDTPLRTRSLAAKNVYCTDELYPMCHTVIKGKYTREAVRFFKQEAIAVDYEQRPKMGPAENFKAKLAEKLSRKSKDRIKKLLKRLGVKFYAE